MRSSHSSKASAARVAMLADMATQPEFSELKSFGADVSAA